MIRALHAADAPALEELIARNHDRLADSFPSTVQVLASGGTRYIAAKQDEWQELSGFWYGIFDEVLIGQIQIKHVDWDVQKAELAYHLDAAYEGKGLAAEALAAVADAAFSIGMYKLYLRIIAANARSIALAERSGFVREGTLRGEYRLADGTRVDLAYYGRLRSRRAR